MIIKSGPDYLEITLLERVPDDSPVAGDIRVTVAAASNGFEGLYDEAWIGRPELETFLAALRTLDRDRRGSAELNAHNPNELKLTVFATDSAGHLGADGWIGRDFVVAQRALLRHRVCFSLDVDPSVFPALVKEFESLGR